MKVNTRVRYGLRAVLQIAQGYGGAPIPISVIAAEQDLSGKYLEQVVGALRRADIIRSHKGVRGGYTLTRPPDQVTLYDVVRALDPQDGLVDCVRDPECCQRSPDCLTRTVWTLLSDKMRECWAGMTLQDLLAKALAAHTERETARSR